jgi:FixJ family two-component response regulator
MAKDSVKGNRTDDSLIFVVDDDPSVRQAIKSLLHSVGLRVEEFGSAAELLKNRRLAESSGAACLILDVRLPGVSGLDFQAELSNADNQLFLSPGTAIFR